MRTKYEILKDCTADIVSDDYNHYPAFWLEHRRIEVLIDIRDTLERRLISLDDTLLKKLLKV